MINTGRWVAIILFGLDSSLRAAGSVAILMGLIRPDLSQMPFAERMGDAVYTVAGIAGLPWAAFTATIAWGLYGWRRWARLLAILYFILALLLVAAMAIAGSLSPFSVGSTVVAILVLLWLINPRVRVAFDAGGVQV